MKCGNREGPTSAIEWEAIKIKKKMNAVRDLRIEEVLGFFEESGDKLEEYSLKTESINASEPMTPKKGSFLVAGTLNKPKKEKKKESIIMQQYVPEEDDTRKLIEAHFRGKPVNINFDKERGEILISYRIRPIPKSVWDIIYSKQMIYLLLR
jgi:hypothetical protein